MRKVQTFHNSIIYIHWLKVTGQLWRHRLRAPKRCVASSGNNGYRLNIDHTKAALNHFRLIPHNLNASNRPAKQIGPLGLVTDTAV